MLFSFKSGSQVYTVHEKPDPASDRSDRAEQLLFVRDGFTFAAFVAAPFWLLSQKMWLAFMGYVVLALLILASVTLTGADTRWILYGILGLHLLIGFEGDSLMRWTLERRGWRQISSVTGATFEECERRFFDHWLNTVPAVAPSNFKPPGEPGGLSPDSLSATQPPPYTGDIIPPKRTGWRSGFSFGRAK